MQPNRGILRFAHAKPCILRCFGRPKTMFFLKGLLKNHRVLRGSALRRGPKISFLSLLAALGRPGGLLGPSWRLWGPSRGPPGDLLAPPGGLLAPPGVLLAPPGGLLGASWGLLGVSWGLLGASWGSWSSPGPAHESPKSRQRTKIRFEIACQNFFRVRCRPDARNTIGSVAGCRGAAPLEIRPLSLQGSLAGR